MQNYDFKNLTAKRAVLVSAMFGGLIGAIAGQALGEYRHRSELDAKIEQITQTPQSREKEFNLKYDAFIDHQKNKLDETAEIAAIGAAFAAALAYHKKMIGRRS